MSVLAVIATIIAILVPTLLLFLGKVIDVLTAPATFKFLFNLPSSVKDLEAAIEALRAAKEDIDKKIADAERQSKIPTSQVTVWKETVDKIIDDLGGVEGFVNKYNRRGNKRFFYSMYLVATECAEYHQRVKDLLKEGSVIPIATENDSERFATAYEVPGSLEHNEVLEFIKRDNSVNVIGIWGMGGVGKTTLLQKIYLSCIGLPDFQHFQHVIYITASSEQSNVSKLQSEIVKKLRLNENGDPHTTIYNYLRNKNFILFIDDLWEAVELTKVGVPDTSSTGGYIRKVVIATRERNVCGNMDAKEILYLSCLNPTQSLILFKEKVGERVIQSHPLIPKLAEDIAKECQGLPLAIITIGRAMSTKTNIGDWKHTLNQLKNSQGLHDLGAEKRLLHRLKISYDNLATDQLRKCFLTISMWPEDELIDPETIIQFWMGIDLIDNFESKAQLYRLGYSLIRSLQAACLLEEIALDEDFLYSKVVKLHDVLRDLALWLVSDCEENKNKWMIKSGIQLQKASNMKAEWRAAKCISLISCNIEMLPSDIPSCPSLLTLVLNSNRLIISESTFCKFQSLTHLDLSNNYFESFPESICDLTKLRYLNLSSNMIIDLPMKLKNLKVLKYLILRNNCISNIPRGLFAELEELLVLDMFDGIAELPYEELKSIENKLLSFGTTVRTEEELSKLMLLSELPIDDLGIQGLHSRTFHFMSMIRNPHRLKELCIERSDGGLMEIVFDKNETDQDIASLNLELLMLCRLKELKRIIWKDIAPEILFAVLRRVQIHNCRRLENITWVVNLPSLEYLSITGCESMRIAFSFNNGVDPQVLTFPSLVRIDLYRLDKLEKICTHSLALPQLKGLNIWRCPLLKELPIELPIRLIL